MWPGRDLLRDGHLLVPAHPGEPYEERIEARIGADEVPLDSAQGPPLAHALAPHDSLLAQEPPLSPAGVPCREGQEASDTVPTLMLVLRPAHGRVGYQAFRAELKTRL